MFKELAVLYLCLLIVNEISVMGIIEHTHSRKNTYGCLKNVFGEQDYVKYIVTTTMFI